VKNIKNISLVIFDMDGLMLDTERISIKAWKKVCTDNGYQIDSTILMKAMGMNVKGAESLFREYLGETFPFHELRGLKLEYAAKIIGENSAPLKKGLYEILNFLEQQPVLKAVATSTSKKYAEKLLSSVNILDRFDSIIYGDEVSMCKPDPEIFLTAASMLNCKPEECIVLEDSENGIMAASRAGMLPIMIPDLKKPSKEIERLLYKRFDSLLEVIKFLSS
jgi:HAD superfamily hydrolase (TIGR01509 family)